MKKLAKVAFALTATLLSFTSAWAAVSIDAGVEHFQWKEFNNGSRLLEESGPRYVFGVDYRTDKPIIGKLYLGYRGTLYTGKVDYDGQTWGGAPVTSSSRYDGTAHEGRVAWRTGPLKGYNLDYTGALGADFWLRRIANEALGLDQKETYQVVYARLGVELSPQGSAGWTASLGVKQPLDAREDVELTSLGFDNNVTVKNGKRASLYASVGYRFDAHWSVTAYYEGLRLAKSNEREVSVGGTPVGTVFQPESRLDVFGVTLGYRF